MINMDDITNYIRSNQSKTLLRLERFCQIPSISTLSEHDEDINHAASWIADFMEDIGMKSVSCMPTDGHPIVYGEKIEADDLCTVLIYGHYDVQPVDPIDEWKSDPFIPEIRGDHLYSRGVSDMKGQIISVLAALESYNQEVGKLPVNVKVIVEGEEEIGSPNLEKFVKENSELLDCDFCMNADSGIGDIDIPGIVYGLRGLAYYELWVYGPEVDLHSGMFGGAIHNPAIVLCQLIANMQDDNGVIQVPGCYDDVEDVTLDERFVMNQLPYDDIQISSSAGNPPELFGEHGYSAIEHISVRPSLDVNGIYSGFVGSGSKTVIPAKAMAKLSLRLVPNQDPSSITAGLERYLKENAPTTVKYELKELAHANPVVVNRNSVAVQGAFDAIKSVYGVEPVFMRMGGTVPVVSMISEILSTDTVMLGFALNDDGIHGPNERLHINNFYRGIEAFAHFFYNLSIKY
ncbi:MAG TPA: dipeptidase [Chloroflexi bacterium]|nr:dipeptidase [Chloroflexota bacterium]|tara:strand:- start:1661 stop:3043 length:1383 start_codon:yes stop_codon:yes gene_type:complete